MSGPLVTAIFEGRKTQTRRVVKPQPIFDSKPDAWDCPYGQPGDLLWVRETWAAAGQHDDRAPRDITTRMVRDVWYQAQEADRRPNFMRGRWRPSIHMPRWASRLTLKVTGIRVERVQDITSADALAEGMTATTLAGRTCVLDGKPSGNFAWTAPDYAFGVIWNDINEKRGYGWKTNPWVWVVEFERVPS